MDDTFLKSIQAFENSIKDLNVRQKMFNEISQQAKYIDNFLRIAKTK